MGEETDAPRPWHVRWRSGFGHEVVAANGRIVQTGFPSMWGALLWARDAIVRLREEGVLLMSTMNEKPELTCPFSGCHGKVPDGTDYCTGCGRPRTSVAEELRALGRDADRRMLPNLPDHLADEPWGHR